MALEVGDIVRIGSVCELGMIIEIIPTGRFTSSYLVYGYMRGPRWGPGTKSYITRTFPRSWMTKVA